MKKKILYGGLILVMLIGMFGVMSPGGVQTVQAAWVAPADLIGATLAGGDLPYYSGLVDLSTATATAGDPVECGTMQKTMFLDVPTSNPGGALNDPAFLHVALKAIHAAKPYNQARVGVFDKATGQNLACGSMGDDLLVPIKAGDSYTIMVGAPSIAPVPVSGVNNQYELLINEVQNDGSLILALTGTAAKYANAAANIATAGGDQVVPFATYTSPSDTFDGFMGEDGNSTNTSGDRFVFFDVPAGDYNLGVYDASATGGWAGVIANAAGPGTVVFDEASATVASTIRTNTIGNAELGLNIALHPVDGVTFYDLPVGTTAGGPPSVLGFRVAPGYLWDVVGYLDNAGAGSDYMLVKHNYNPLLGDVDFRLATLNGTHPAVVRQTLDQGASNFSAAKINIDPQGALQPRDLDLTAANYVTPVPVNVDLLLSPNIDYTAHVEIDTTTGWTYFLTPEIQPFSFPSWVDADADATIDNAEVQYRPIWAERWASTMTFESDASTSQEEYLAPADVMLSREGWFDADMNELYRVVAPDGTELVCFTGAAIPADGLADEIAPCSGWRTAMMPLADTTLLANDWATTDLGPVSGVGRYAHERRLQTDGSFAKAGNVQDMFAISPADTTMLGHWSWSWVMAMYEYDFTNGVDGVNYGVDQNVSRGQMAAFLGRVMEAYGLAPLGLAEEFDDVSAEDYYHDAVMLLRDYNITNGVGDNLYDPEAEVSREQMAKFIEETFRAIQAYTGAINHWDPSWGAIPTGLVFVDVGMDNWAVTYIEELFLDGLTDGCGRDGLNISYCPKAPVLRSEMAKFIISAVQIDDDTQGFWPILAPEK